MRTNIDKMEEKERKVVMADNKNVKNEEEIDFITYINTLREDYKKKYGRLMTEEEALEYANELQRKSLEDKIFNEN